MPYMPNTAGCFASGTEALMIPKICGIINDPIRPWMNRKIAKAIPVGATAHNTVVTM